MYKVVGYLYANLKIDPDLYLSEGTILWCTPKLEEINHPLPPAANEFLPAIRCFVLPAQYRELRILVRNHIDGGEISNPLIAPKPEGRVHWEARQQLVDEFRKEVDTFGIVEDGNVEEEDDGDWNYQFLRINE